MHMHCAHKSNHWHCTFNNKFWSLTECMIYFWFGLILTHKYTEYAVRIILSNNINMFVDIIFFANVNMIRISSSHYYGQNSCKWLISFHEIGACAVIIHFSLDNYNDWLSLFLPLSHIITTLRVNRHNEKQIFLSYFQNFLVSSCGCFRCCSEKETKRKPTNYLLEKKASERR